MSNSRCKHGRWTDVGCEDCGIAPTNKITTRDFDREHLPNVLDDETTNPIEGTYDWIAEIEFIINNLNVVRSYLPNDNSRRLHSLAITDLESAVNWLRRLE